MNFSRNNSIPSINIVREIARKTLAGQYDILLACRDLAAFRDQITNVDVKITDVFVGEASEIDGLPLGDERQYWAANSLEVKDLEAVDYRQRVRDVVELACRQLLDALGPSV